MTELCKGIEEDTGIKISIEEELNPRYLNQDLEIGVYRILQESLNNVVKHAQTRSVIVKLTNTQESLSLCIKDEGKGFNYEETKLYVQDMARKNNGLCIMKERAEMIGGKLRILSASDIGTTIQLDIAL